ncbi:structural maintenance of chromosomes protein 1B [Genypterus blacodes]|uniref:structural maintenance of chromosomes protein 1B n=1 Tax=Genypterus blacodes TaxID=154954 RepID=UPI003F758C02
MAYLKQIDIENFKSWRGKQVIGPFMRYSCIIGTNGSGKSNIMDAVGFVMGERAAALRVKHLPDLIHGAHVGKPVSRTASVALRYRDHREQEVVFCRIISGNSSEYCVSGERVSMATYIEELRKIGIVTKARNCLVFQGAVESIAMKHPKELTKLFESISESGELASEYDEKREALEKAKGDTEFHFSKKKSAFVEKKELTSEKTQAEKYNELVEELNQARLHLMLAELCCNEKSIREISDDLEEKQLQATAESDEVENLEQAVRTHKKEQGRLTREQQHIEKEIRAQEQILSQRQSQYIKTKVDISYRTKKAEDLHAALTKAQRQMAAKEQKLREGRQEMDELERTWRDYETQAQEQGIYQGRDIQLEEEQLERYNELKVLSRKQSGFLCQQADKLHWEVRAEQEQMAFYQRKKKEVEGCIRNNQTHLKDLTSRAEKLQDFTKTCKASLEKYRKQEESLSAELQRGSQRNKEVNEELGQVLAELNSACLDTQESQRQHRRRDVLEMLRRFYPESVYGRLSDLCSPIHRKYQLAVTKVCGHYMNAIVVSSEKAARDCITIIKQERAEPETFLPIDYLDVRPLNERLREVRGAKMIVDVIQVNSASAAAHLSKVVQFVCGNTLVCETITEARRMAFDGPERIKTVSLDGTMFAKSGVISGGSTSLQAKARCWEAKGVAQLKERKEKLMAEMRGLMKLKRKESELKQFVAEAQGAQTRLKYANMDLENMRKKNIPKCQAEISRLESELVNVESQIQMQRDCLEVKEAEIKQIREKIEQMEDVVFADFCAEIGVDNIREYEQVHLTQQAELNKKRLEFENQCARLNAHLEYEGDQLKQQKRKHQRMEESVSKEERAIVRQKKEEEKLLAAVDETQTKLVELEEQLVLKKSQVSSAKAELAHKTQSLQAINKQLVKLQREVMSAESASEQKRLARHNLLLACKIQALPITLLSGSLDEISNIQVGLSGLLLEKETHIYEREAQLAIDYSCLQPGLLDMEQEMEAHLERLRGSVSSMEEVLQSTMAPNLKAAEKMKTLEDTLKDVKQAFDVSAKEARKCNQDFQQVKARRLRRFIQCFEHVCVKIDQIYKRICRNSSAQAILSADNPDEPYLGGIKYNCVAPGKRFMAMNNLSGGEKAIAALALVFAIHSFRPAPFFILDEVDAALDNTNINKVTSFFRKESKQKTQLIIISQKEQFFSKADALLGVYSQFNDCMFSGILSLDLRPFPLDPEDDPFDSPPIGGGNAPDEHRDGDHT